MIPNRVALARCSSPSDRAYPEFPYDPDSRYPEYPTGRSAAGRPNPVYDAVRECLYLLDLDRSHYDTSCWNPLGEIIQPGQQVLIKPNWVKHRHGTGGDLFSMITHPSVIRPVIDYVQLALKGEGRIIVADAPLQSAHFDLLMQYTQIPELIRQIATEAPLEVRDLRENICRYNDKGEIVAHESCAGDPEGYAVVNLGSDSSLTEIEACSRNFRVTNYDHRVMPQHHNRGRHEYLIAKTVLNSDVVIGVPKLKTHRKAGLTCCLKNLVGINGSKDYLPHHRLGAREENGDEYLHSSHLKRLHSRLRDAIDANPGSSYQRLYYWADRVLRCLLRHVGRDPYYEGSWYGNDTVWRMIVDLNYALRFAQSDGICTNTSQRKIFHIVDAVVVGAGEGPLSPEGVPAGMILAGQNSGYVDACAARLIGLDPEKIPLLPKAMALLTDDADSHFPCRLACRDKEMNDRALDDIKPLISASPPLHWRGHVELETD